MSQVQVNAEPARLMLEARTAAELMSQNPVSLRADATVAEAIELLTRRGFSAAPVIDLSGRAVGVVSCSDVLVHERERSPGPPAADDGEEPATAIARVRDIMTPAVFSVTPDESAAEVVKQMLDLKVHHLFVVDKTGVLTGMISSLDILKHLHAGDA